MTDKQGADTGGTGAELLAILNERLGAERVDKIVGAWLAESHRDRPRLMLAKPEGPARAPHYLAFVRGLSCAMCEAPAPNDAHHFGRSGVAMKADDYRTIPMCRRCHNAWHEGRGERDLARYVVDTLVRYLRTVEHK